ncbi:hypothetical protein FAM09_15905 [Niastella caeni]|uniref:YEATS domain-containing protein n=1 Tax=Niastella caeni TaxID=2569763 RepID=A0A4S8HRT4_9BACT|nr:pYEATS domain-containing protein [Niastella caeni]THU38163.1 hypothetical protein FAM09_15905 [Niastella caeni]
MKNIVLIILLLWACQAYAQNITVTNDASPATRKGYYNWKVYLVASSTVLSTIKEVVYTLHPTFKYPVQTVKASTRNRNFSYSASGWGEFDIKVKIVYNNSKRTPLYLVHHLRFSKAKG